MDIIRLHALRALDDVKLHALILIQRPETWDVDGFVVYEDILASAVVNSDETETLIGVEPFDGSQSHSCSPAKTAPPHLTVAPKGSLFHRLGVRHASIDS